jgi:hypothetical protein
MEDVIPDLQITPQHVSNTPSRAEGMSAEKERQERFLACKLVRSILKRLITGEDTGSTSPERRDVLQHAQCLACYYLQLFFLYYAIDDRSLETTQRRTPAESVQVVVLAAMFLACKVTDFKVLMRELMRAYADVREKENSVVLTEERSKEFQRRVPSVESRLIHIMSLSFSQHLFDITLPQDVLESKGDSCGLVHAFVANYKKLGYSKIQSEAAEEDLRVKVLRKARDFVSNSFLGVCPLLFPASKVAAGAVSLAMQQIDRTAKLDHIRESLQAIDNIKLSDEDFKAVREELLNVFRTATEIKKLEAASGKSESTTRAPENKIVQPCSSANASAAAVASKPDSGTVAPMEVPKTCAKQERVVATENNQSVVPVVPSVTVSRGPNGAGNPIRSTNRLSEMRAHPYMPGHISPTVAAV